MEEYLDADEVVFASPISRRENTKEKDTPSPLHKPNLPNNILNIHNSNTTNNTSSKLWALGKQSLDDDRVFKFEEEERSPVKQPYSAPFGEMRDKKKDKSTKKLNFKSRWDSPETSEDDSEDEDKENRRVNSGSCKTTLDFLEIEAKLQQMKIDKKIEREAEPYTRLVCTFL